MWRRTMGGHHGEHQLHPGRLHRRRHLDGEFDRLREAERQPECHGHRDGNGVDMIMGNGGMKELREWNIYVVVFWGDFGLGSDWKLGIRRSCGNVWKWIEDLHSFPTWEDVRKHWDCSAPPQHTAKDATKLWRRFGSAGIAIPVYTSK